MESNEYSRPQVSIVVPLYNEYESFPILIQRLNTLLDNTALSIEVVLVNDGSSDDTEDLMSATALIDSRYVSVFLSRNYGHQIAVSAGLQVCRATEAVMIIDGDLQDPPELLSEFYEAYKSGYDIIYGTRKIRSDEGWFKRKTSHWFYRIINKLSETNIPYDSGDFCLLSRKVVDTLNKMPEKKRFLRGMRAWIGFKQKSIVYDREARAAGSTKYPLKKMLRLAFDAIFGFSELPVKFMTRLGMMSIIISLFYLGFTIYKKIFYGDVISGFTGILFSVILFSGVQLISLGILGEYIIRIFFQVNDRPLFVVKGMIANKEYINE